MTSSTRFSFDREDGFSGASSSVVRVDSAKSAGEHQRWTGRPDVDLPGSAFPEFLDGVILQLGSSDDGVFAEDDPIAADDFLDRDQFHGGDEVPDFLEGGV